jgi:hypothetical protein
MSMKRIVQLLIAALLAGTVTLAAEPAAPGSVTVYPDGRPSATLRMEAKDQGVVLKHGDGPGQCDILGARDAGLAWLDLPLTPPAGSVKE